MPLSGLRTGPIVLFLVAFLGGMAGSLHCIGMCGVFPVSLARAGGAHPLRRQVLYNAGRLNTLAFIGALSGAFGAAVAATGPFRSAERVLAVAAGSLMVLIGLEMLGLVGRISARAAAFTQRTLTRWLSGVMSSPSAAAPLALGIFNAFLPCQLIYAFAARAAATASVLEGALLMVTFGAGTLPAMLALGTVRPLATWRWRGVLARSAGVLVIVFGLVTLARGLWPELGHVGGGHQHH